MQSLLLMIIICEEDIEGVLADVLKDVQSFPREEQVERARGSRVFKMLLVGSDGVKNDTKSNGYNGPR